MNADYLRKHAARADAMARTLGDERATRLLTAAAAHLREGAAIYVADPTLVRDPAHRDRHLDLLGEIGRQLTHLVKQAVDGRMPERWPIAQRWEEAEAVAGRMPGMVADARRAAVDITDRSASEKVSALRLTACAGYAEESAETIRSLLRPSLDLPYPHPAAKRLAELADEISRTVASIDSEDV